MSQNLLLSHTCDGFSLPFIPAYVSLFFALFNEVFVLLDSWNVFTYIGQDRYIVTHTFAINARVRVTLDFSLF